MQVLGHTMDDASVTAWVGHSLSGAAIVGTFAGWFPPVAAAAAFIWYSIQIWESATVQIYLTRRRTRRIAKLKAKLLQLETLQKEDPKP